MPVAYERLHRAREAAVSIYQRDEAVPPVVEGNYGVPLITKGKVCVSCGDSADTVEPNVEGFRFPLCRNPTVCLDRAGVKR